ncbi:MAG: serine/threonine protein kinase [Archangiaceae bacterium]|nr:serine/threonine protein kinase [Archangiaceae bacterium]
MNARVGRFELLERLGHGGMGEVFLARADGASSVVVLKRLLPHLAHDRELGRQFLREAGIAARLVHPHIARVLELGEAGGTFFFTMEFIEGRSLNAVGPLPFAPAVRVIADAAEALDAAHSATDASGRPLGVVHGDVTPRNLIVGTDGSTRLIDFGLSKLKEHRDEDSLGGTYEYMAPEQALEGVTDSQTDQFSLGVVFWELLTGRRLFGGDSDVATIDQVVEGRVAPSGTAFDDVVMRMLEKEPSRRFARCGEVATLLERWLSEQRAVNVRAELGQRVSVKQRVSKVAPSVVPHVTAEVTDGDQVALQVLARLSQPMTLEALEAAIGLDAAQALVERGLVQRHDDGTFSVG